MNDGDGDGDADGEAGAYPSVLPTYYLLSTALVYYLR